MSIWKPCSYSGCRSRRTHFESEEMRLHQLVEVGDDFAGERQYCSLECAIYDGAYSVTKGWIPQNKENVDDI